MVAPPVCKLLELTPTAVSSWVTAGVQSAVGGAMAFGSLLQTDSRDRAGQTAWLALLVALHLPLVQAVGAAEADESTAATERLLLSGTSPADAVRWQFRIEGDGKEMDQDLQRVPASEFVTIAVPSHWQQHGFGRYAYGQRDPAARDSGHYRREFEVPAEWADHRIDLVFGGAMTDTTAWVDGRSVGPTHLGGFTEFRWDVTELVQPGTRQQLDVRVQEHSTNESVNRAERQADYWTFGGIYRPVWLEARPLASIDRIALGANARGDLHLEIDCVDAGPDAQVRTVVRRWSPRGEHPGGGNGPVLATAATRCRQGAPTLLDLRVPSPTLWSAERPQLHTVELVLERGDATREVLHRVTRRFGFRSLERRDDGLYLNGSRLILKGVNRHSFRPESGRALSPEQNRDDVALIRSFHFNAVRTAHSPPDPEFLDACDELGLYVIDELPGWHDAYDTKVSRRMVREMVQRDQHHPSILFWANGNEGGWNRAAESEFARWDPQERIVLRPWAAHNGFETRHYPSYADLLEILDERSMPSRLTRLRQGRHPLVMPTEILHGLYDGGGGAGLADYWQLLEGHPRFAGMFLWALFDEGLERFDRDLQVDTFGNHAPDGLFDPYRRPEPSARRVRELFAPVQVEDGTVAEDGSFEVRLRNAFHQFDLSQVQVDVEWFVVPDPFAEAEGGGARAGDTGAPEAFATRRVALGDAAPGKGSTLRVARPAGMPLVLTVGEDGTAAAAPVGARLIFRVAPALSGFPPWTVGSAVVLPAEERLRQLWRAAGRDVDPWTPAPTFAPTQGIGRLDDGTYERVPGAQPRADGHGWFLAQATGANVSHAVDAYDLGSIFEGLGLRLCEAQLTWFGRGPDRVWANRLGGQVALWQRELSELCESADQTALGPFASAGLYDALWLRLDWPGVGLVLLPESDTLTGLGDPRFPDDARLARAVLPELTEQSVVLWHANRAPAMGTKFHRPAALRGPPAESPDGPSARWMVHRVGAGTGPALDPASGLEPD